MALNFPSGRMVIADHPGCSRLLLHHREPLADVGQGNGQVPLALRPPLHERVRSHVSHSETRTGSCSLILNTSWSRGSEGEAQGSIGGIPSESKGPAGLQSNEIYSFCPKVFRGWPSNLNPKLAKVGKGLR